MKVLSDLALDAPLATTAWWALVHRHFGSGSPAGPAAALFLGVWGIYLCDRLYDASKNTGLPGGQPPRKVFARNNRRLIAILAGTALPAAGTVGVCFVSARIWGQASAGAALTLGYFILFRWLKMAGGLPFKESMIAFCFGVSLGIPFEPDDPLSRKAGSLAALGGLCLLNCLIISRAEAAYDNAGDPSAWFAGKPDRQRSFPFFRVVFGIALFLVFLAFLGAPCLIDLTLLLSLAMLALLIGLHCRRESWLPPDAIQPLADAALWFPAVMGLLADALVR